MQSRGSWSPLSGISGTTSSGSWWRVKPDTGNVRMSQYHKKRTCRLTAMRRVGRSFVPVIFLTNHCAPGDAFFFKWIFSGEAVRKILLKTGGNAADRGAMVYFWWKGKTVLSLFCKKLKRKSRGSVVVSRVLCKFVSRVTPTLPVFHMRSCIFLHNVYAKIQTFFLERSVCEAVGR